MTKLDEVLGYIDRHRGEYIGLLQAFCRQPSQSATGEGIPEMVALLERSLCAVGARPKRCETGGNPVVYAHIPGDSPRTFGFYGHYDVQPVDPVELWEDDPYAAVIRGGVLCARGVADNKNGLASKLCAVDAWNKVCGGLPCGVKFFIEGEEEIGSPHLEQFAAEYEELLDCDGYNWESGWKEVGGPPEIHLGAKGLLYVQLRVKTAETDAHSCHAAIVENSAWRLVQALGSIKDREDNILIRGFYDGAIPPNEADIENLRRDNFNEEGLKRYLGIDGFLGGLTGQPLLEKNYYAPTANICGMESGYTGEGSKTVLPCEAGAKLDFRLVPGQDPRRIFRLLREHLDRCGFADVQAELLSAQPAFRTDPQAPFVQAVTRALRGLFGEPVVHHMVTGTSPMPVFCSKKGIPAAMFGCISTEANIHAPNERLAVDSYIDEVKMIAAVMAELGR